MENTVYIWTPEEVPEMDAFSICDEIPVKSDLDGLCSCCDGNKAQVLVRYERAYDGMTKQFRSEICLQCYCCEDHQRFMRENKILSVTEINN